MPVNRPPAGAPPTWGLGDDGPAAGFTVPLDQEEQEEQEEQEGDETSWLTALAVTLRRYDTETSPVIGTDHGGFTVVPAATLGASKPSPATGAALTGLLFSTPDEEEEGTGAREGAHAQAAHAYADGDSEIQYVPCLAPPFPLTLSVFRDSGGWQLRCDHLRSHFSAEIAAQFVRHVMHVHKQVLNRPHTPVDDVELLDEAERARTAALGRPARAVVAAAPASVPGGLDRIVAAAPDRVAVTDGSAVLTYRQLDEWADRLAAGLRARGVVGGDRVGVCLERSAELVVALLAVLKSGATYVPLDPAYPADRLAHTAQDAELGVVITRGPGFPAVADCVRVTPDELADSRAPEEAAANRPSPSPDDAAYVIYTSGSTGRPKGVVVPHRNVIALVDATRDEYGLGAADVWTWFHSSAFDFSVWEIWGCLLTGGRLVVVPYSVSREPDRFRDLLVAERVTVLSQTPSAFAQLLDVDHADAAVRLVVLGGEPVDARALLPWFDRHPERVCRVVNMFGITETTVHVTEQTLTRKLALAATRSVGRALPGWHLYVVDPAGRLLPPGVAGEICVGGAGVALGYLGQEELTGRRFVPDPFTGDVMYRSGDLGRLRSDGRLEHLGRIDSQVKIRGFRIELDEIRSVLLEDPAVRTAAVVVRRDEPADAATARIDAYVVLSPGSDPGAVRERAAGILPEHMLPAAVTALDALPLTPNGKLDAARLPAPAARGPRAPGTTRAVNTVNDLDDLTASLTEIWSEVLGVPVGLDDDFFELGGNSLFAVRIGAALRARGLPSLRLRELYRHPTVRATAAGLRAAAETPGAGTAAALAE
ncbi:non-ribosomal peptide synthetase [Streptomyces sp. ME02-8801-2C]|uniref:non-ribosomal peptide synthetase n=1 Tax=Streptomyces sp. ME02-8801-2C TaxID=3028680 RepID=UPI0039F6F479